MSELLRFEQELWKSGLLRVAGVDEVGMGPLAGPVVAAAVILPMGLKIEGVRDSKQLSVKHRESLAEEIYAQALGIGIGVAEVAEIDRLNIYHAGLLAMNRAVGRLPVDPQFVLADARFIPDIPWPQKGIIRGDAKSQSIAAASIVAKVFRDRTMITYDRHYPQYGFGRHKGYPTPEHQRALAEHGPCPIHRSSFTSVAEFAGYGNREFYRLKTALVDATSARQCKNLENELFAALPQMSPHESKKLKLLFRRACERAETAGRESPSPINRDLPRNRGQRLNVL